MSSKKKNSTMGAEMKLIVRQRREESLQLDSPASSSSEELETPVRRKPVVRKKTFSKKKGITLASVSGALAALAGSCAKMSFSPNETLSLCEQISNSYMNYSSQEAFNMCSKASLYLRLTAFVAMILINSVMWTTFVKALRYCHTSLEATVINSAVNFFLSAIFGKLLFDESLSFTWGCGSVVIIAGMLLVNHGGNKNYAELRRLVAFRREKFKSR